MHVTLLALGSRGDVLPYATLGKALRAAGHGVCFATFESFQTIVQANDLDFHPIQGDPRAILNAASGQALAESGRSALRMSRAVMGSFGAMADGFARDLTPLAQRQTDLILSQLPGGLYSAELAEVLGVPLWTASVIPMTPTSAWPMLSFPRALASVPGFSNWSYWAAYQLVWQGFRPAINRWRQDTLGLPRAPLRGDPKIMSDGRVPVLNGFSRHVVPRPPDWGPHVHLSGYWFPEEPGWQPPDDLRRFLDAGPPPVFVSFGSMPLRQPEKVTATVLEALKRSGKRGILGAAWGGIGDGAMPDDVLRIEYAPYGWLFPRMAAVVHHGGSGTTAFGLRAGVPSLVVPFLFDQYYWGERLQALGVGPEPLPFKELSADRLAEAIAHATDDEEMRRCSAELGTRLRQEDGLQNAVDILTRRS
jgi:UDP:flavonoid glycosyltransferase YjiC (YdhE family)